MTNSFAAIEAVARVLQAFPRPWFVSGGWAIDLFLGQVSRAHEDLEVGILRVDQQELRRYLAGWELCKAVATADSGEWVAWPAGEWLALPVHQLRAQRPGSQPAEFEFFLNDTAGQVWQCRRNPAITRPVSALAGRTPNGIPFLLPEIQLLYKARWHRPKDEHDFHTALPVLAVAQRTWLRQSLEICHPGDPWIAEL